jgi:hypothetical protein
MSLDPARERTQPNTAALPRTKSFRKRDEIYSGAVVGAFEVVAWLYRHVLPSFE